MISQDKWQNYTPVDIQCTSLSALPGLTNGDCLLLVTTPGFVNRGVTEDIRKILHPKKIIVWTDFMPNPDIRDISCGLKQLHLVGFDSVIALGGGSAIDAAKILSHLLTSSKPINLDGILKGEVEYLWQSRLPLITIPTTSGTGSEVTPFATVWDHAENKKYSISGDSIYPDIALLCPNLTLSLGYEATLYPALDAISHLLESIWNKNRTPITISLAMSGLTLADKSLSKLLQELDSIKLRSYMQTVALLGGLAISQSKTAIAHSISYPITSHFKVPHGLACSFTLPALIRRNLETQLFPTESIPLINHISNFLNSLSLGSRVLEYASINDIKKINNEMFTLGRADNYIGRPIGSFNELLDEALS